MAKQTGPDRAAGKEQVEPQGGPQPLPMFYEKPQPLHKTAHGDKGLKQPINYRFAAEAHAVVIHTQEFRLAAASYPIIFSDDEGAMPLAILGYRDGENLFVDGDGHWAQGAYIPSYVRRYPFAIGQPKGQAEAILYVDGASDLIVDMAADPEAAALFTDGAPSARTMEMNELCAAFQQQVPLTSAFVEEVRRRELLDSKEIRLDLPSGDPQLLTGLRIIDEDKFNALPDEAILEWRRQGWLPLVFWHWASMDNFLRLIERGGAGN